jgi:CRISPR-associated protein Csy2
VLDAWLDLSRFNWRPAERDNHGKVIWRHDRPAGSGWLVPIPVGYAALGELHPPGSVRDARDANTPFRFVEGLYSLGQWISPHRLERPDQLLWFADSQPEAGHYRCRNAFADTPAGALSA